MDIADHGSNGQSGAASTMDREQMGRLFPDHSNGPDASTAPSNGPAPRREHPALLPLNDAASVGFLPPASPLPSKPEHPCPASIKETQEGPPFVGEEVRHVRLLILPPACCWNRPSALLPIIRRRRTPAMNPGTERRRRCFCAA
jgi:hypothetical protein